MCPPPEQMRQLIENSFLVVGGERSPAVCNELAKKNESTSQEMLRALERGKEYVKEEKKRKHKEKEGEDCKQKKAKESRC